MINKLKYGLIVLIAVSLVFFIWPWRLSLLDDPFSVIIEDQSGQLLSAQIAADGQWRFPMMDSIPIRFVEAITTFEDKRFKSHWGVDIWAVMRALKQNIVSGQIISGASTISMQVIRLSQKDADRSLIQKFKEALLSFKLESQYSKTEILRLYAAHAPFGGNVVGLEAASWRYFSKSPFSLSPAETATLAVLPNAPGLVTLSKNRERLLRKRNYLLNKMYLRGLLSKEDFSLAAEEPIVSSIYKLPHSTPHLLELAKKEDERGRIKTTIKVDIQQRVNDILDSELIWLSQNGIYNAAILVLDTRTSVVLAYGANPLTTIHESAVDMIQARRSSGSIIKPFLYAAMLDEGLITPDALLQDTPLYIDGFSPANYNKDFSGAVSASEALTRSLNIPFVLLLREYGIEKFINKLRKMGFTTLDKSGEHYGLSLILGGAEVSLWELTSAYAAMGASFHSFSKTKDFKKIQIPTAHYQLQFSHAIESPFSVGAIHHTFEAMRSVMRPDEHGDWEVFSSSRDIAWKTGTSYGHRDAWAVGITPDYTIGVWAGNADGEGRDQLIGTSTAGKLLFNTLDAVSQRTPWFEEPFDDMSQMAICHESGMLPSVNCQLRDTIWLANSTIKSKTCPYHKNIFTDINGQWQVYQNCSDTLLKSSLLVLPPLMGKYYKMTHPEYKSLPPIHPLCQMQHDGGNAMEIIYPYPDEKIYIPRDFEGDRQKIVAQVVHTNPSATVFWYLNGRYLGETQTFHTMSFLEPFGHYKLLCSDSEGQILSQNFEIVSK